MRDNNHCVHLMFTYNDLDETAKFIYHKRIKTTKWFIQDNEMLWTKELLCDGDSLPLTSTQLSWKFLSMVFHLEFLQDIPYSFFPLLFWKIEARKCYIQIGIYPAMIKERIFLLNKPNFSSNYWFKWITNKNFSCELHASCFIGNYTCYHFWEFWLSYTRWSKETNYLSLDTIWSDKILYINIDISQNGFAINYKADIGSLQDGLVCSIFEVVHSYFLSRLFNDQPQVNLLSSTINESCPIATTSMIVCIANTASRSRYLFWFDIITPIPPSLFASTSIIVNIIHAIAKFERIASRTLGNVPCMTTSQATLHSLKRSVLACTYLSLSIDLIIVIIESMKKTETANTNKETLRLWASCIHKVKANCKPTKVKKRSLETIKPIGRKKGIIVRYEIVNDTTTAMIIDSIINAIVTKSSPITVPSLRSWTIETKISYGFGSILDPNINQSKRTTKSWNIAIELIVSLLINLFGVNTSLAV